MKNATTKVGYSERMRTGVIQFIILKPFSMIIGILILSILSSNLSKADFAEYITIWASVEILIALSNFGILQGVYKLVAGEQCQETRKVIIPGNTDDFLILRLATILGTLFVFSLIARSISAIDFLFEKQLFHLFIFVVVFETIARHTETILDSTVCQKEVQISLITRSTLKVFLYLSLFSSGHFSTGIVLLCDVMATGIGACLATTLKNNKIEMPSKGNNLYFKKLYLSLTAVIIPAYLADILAIGFGVDILKVALSQLVTPSAVAMFGAGFAVTGLVQRYIPSVVLAGLLRAAMVRAADKNHKSLQLIFSFITKINLFFTCVFTIIFCHYGEIALNILTDGKYTDAVNILLALSLANIMLATRFTLSTYCLAIGDTKPTLTGAFIATTTLLSGLIISSNVLNPLLAAGLYFLAECAWCIGCIVHLIYLKKNPISQRNKTIHRALLAASGITAINIAWHFVSGSSYFLGILSFMVILFAVSHSTIFDISDRAILSSLIPVRFRFKP